MPQPPKISADAVLEQALAQVEDSGAAALSLRGLAGALGVTPNALYWHYADRGALLTAVASRGIDELRHALRAAVPAGAGDLAALMPVAEAYLEFARRRPHLYALITAPGRDAGISGGLWDDVTALLSPFVGADRAAEAGLALWAYLHGAAGLEALDPFHDKKPREGMQKGLLGLVRALGESAGQDSA